MCDDEKTRLNPKNGMSAEEAISWIKRIEINGNLKELTALWMAMEALNNKMPKKPVCLIINKKYYSSYCPYCDMNISEEWSYCPYCGQAIDWSDDNDQAR